MDRLERNTRHLLELLDDLKAPRHQILFPTRWHRHGPDSDLGGAMAQAMMTIISAFAQLERVPGLETSMRPHGWLGSVQFWA